MLIRLTELFEAADGRGAFGAFTCYDLETVRAVLDTGDERGRPVTILVSAGSFRSQHGEAFLAAVLRYADQAPARSCVQVDHLVDLQLVARALELGAPAVMVDGSRLPFEENVALGREAVAIARSIGADVEVELGRIEGDEDVAQASRAGALTDPEEARRFVQETGAQCLAVSVGNSHGRYASPPTLDWYRLQELAENVDVPLALHGASGIPDADVRRAIELGIRKVNVNTDLRIAYLDATAAGLDRVRESAALAELHETQVAAVSALVAEKLEHYDLDPSA
jgi:fructose-bisphosphate aldolase class II